MPKKKKDIKILKGLILALTTILLVLCSQFLTVRAIAENSDKQNRADLLFEQGIKEYQTEQFQSSIQSWQQALNIYQKQIKDGTTDEASKANNLLHEKGKILSNLGAAYYHLEKYDRAISYYQQRTNISRQINDPYGEAKTLNAMGRIYYILGKYPEAIGLYQKSLLLAKQIQIPQGEGITLNNLGDVYIALGDYERGIDYYRQSIAIAVRIGDRTIESQSLGQIGKAYEKRQEYRQAIEHFQKSLVLARAVENRQKERSILNSLGITFYKLGDFNKAIEYHQQSRTRAAALGQTKQESQSLNYLGSCYYALGDYNTAISYYQQSLTIAEKINAKQEQAQILNNLGSTYATLGNQIKAISYYEDSLAIAKEIDAKQEKADSFGKLGLAYYALGEYQKGIYCYQQQLILVRKIGTKAREQQVAIDLGKTYLALKDYIGVIETYEQIINFSNLPDDRQQAIVLGTLGNAYLALGNNQRAIEYLRPYLAITQRIKDIHGQKIALNHLGLALYNTGNLAEAERLLRKRIALEENQVNSDKFSRFEQQYLPGNTLQKTLIAENKPLEALVVAERSRERYLIDLLGRKNINFEPKKLEIADITEIARTAKATLIFYSLPSNTKLYTWAIEPTGEIVFSWQELNAVEKRLDRSPLIDLISRFENSVELGSETEENQTKLLQELYQILIESIADTLPKKSEERIIFVPEKELFLVPFFALKDRQGKYLIENNQISTIPTIKLLESPQVKSKKTAKLSQSLVIGDLEKGIKVPAILNAKKIDSKQATETKVKKLIPEARVIYLTTDRLFDRNFNNSLSFIPSKDDDGRLTPQEILKLDLNARIAIIQGINLKPGEIQDSGILSLSTALIRAGVDKVVISLWSTSEEPALNLIDQFYINWEKNGDVSQSLREAILSSIKSKNPTKDWAAFTLIGG